jgi:hypothetical protein
MTLEPNANEPGERERAAERERQAEAERRMLEEMAAEAAAKEPDAPSEQPAERRRGIGGIGTSGLPEQRGLSSRMRGSPPELTDYAAALGGDDRPINVDPAVQFAQSPKLEVGPTTGMDLPQGPGPSEEGQGQGALGDDLSIPLDAATAFSVGGKLEGGPTTGIDLPAGQPVEDRTNEQGLSNADWADRVREPTSEGPPEPVREPYKSPELGPRLPFNFGTGAVGDEPASGEQPGGETLEPATVDSSGEHVSALSFMEPDPSVRRPQTGGGQQQAAVDTGPVVVAGHNPNQTRTRPRTLVLGIEKGNGEEQGEAMAIPGGGAP